MSRVQVGPVHSDTYRHRPPGDYKGGSGHAPGEPPAERSTGRLNDAPGHHRLAS